MSNIYGYQGNIVFEDVPHLSVPWATGMHRGYASSTVHENTLEAFYRAYLNGANCIETDARLSSDGVYICSHDATVTVGGVTYTIANETAETLSSLVLSIDPTYGECHIPTLSSVLKLCCYTGMTANIDCKAINAATLAQLVVDSGMSGRAVYANTSTSNAAAILAVDPNAGFLFSYSTENLATWSTALTDYHVRNRSYAWATTVSNAVMEATRALGFKYLLSDADSTINMHFAPDCIEFKATANCKTLNAAYLASLDFGL